MAKLALTAKQRLRLMERVFKGGASVASACREFGVSRSTFYKWAKKYDPKLSRNKNLENLRDKKPYFDRRHLRAKPDFEKEILSLVIEFPRLSKYDLAEKLAQRLGPVVGIHGVYNVLVRHDLNHPESRLAYSQVHAPEIPAPAGWVDRVRYVLEQFIPSLAPALPPALSTAWNFLKAFVASIIISSATFYSLLWWVSFVSSQVGRTAIGLIFASIAFVMGTVFFLYSLKYYLTLAIVLSFSQQEAIGGGVNGNGNGRRRGFLSWILGLANGNGNGNGKNGRSGPVGLEPNLARITLKRHPLVSIQIPFYNEKNVVERAIAAATNFDYQGEYEVILADDSTDETTTIIRNYQKKYLARGERLKETKGDGWTLTQGEVKPGVTLKHLHRTSRKGFKGGALGKALELTDPRAEFISVFDADFVPYPDTLELFLKYFKVQNNMSEDYKKSNVAAVQGYQWHVLNKSENWITKGIRSEYAGSYVIERSGTEIYGGLKMISGAVYMIRRDVLEEVGWETSITEDFQLTLKLYEKGYKVVYTPYVQAPAECVSTLKRLIRQRMRWAEGHSNNIRKMFKPLMFSQKLTTPEKLEFLYLSPYYLQAFFFLIGTFSWLISETLFPARLPFWTSLWGWSLVLTNMLSLPLMNTVGLFLEESEEKDYRGLPSFIALSYIIVPFQAYASLKGFLKGEGPWFRTPKTGRITDVLKRGTFYRFISGILPGRAAQAPIAADCSRLQPTSASISSQISVNPYVALATANNTSTRLSAFSTFNSFNLKPKRVRWLGRVVLATFLAISTTLISFTPFIPQMENPRPAHARGSGMILGPEISNPDPSGYTLEPSLKVLNPYSHPRAGEDWEVRFETTGRADLTITPDDQATIDDLDFVSLKCGDEERNPKIFDGPAAAGASADKDTIFYPNWECSGEGRITHHVNVAGKHTLKFQFGGQTAYYAYNSASSLKASPTDDTTVWQGYPTSNYGTYLYMSVQTRLNNNDRSFLQFDLSSIPAGATITNAKLYSYFAAYWNTYSINIQARQMSDDAWDELTATWNTQPAMLATVEDTVAVAATYGWYNWDVTTHIANEYAGDGIASIGLRAETEDSASATYKFFYTMNYTTDKTKRPYLLVEYDSNWITPTAVQDKCGEDASYPATKSIDNDARTGWSHDANGSHWIIYDLGATYTVTKVGLYTNPNGGFQPCGATSLKVCDDAACVGESSVGSQTWTGALDWYELDITDTAGRYIKMDFNTFWTTCKTPNYFGTYNQEDGLWEFQAAVLEDQVATAYSFQRKTWYDGTRLWKAFYSGTEIEFWYSADWGSSWTQNTSATITVSTNDFSFSIEADSSNAFVVYTSSNDIRGAEASSYPGTGFSWGSEVTVLDGSGATNNYDYPTISIDSSDYLWVAARFTGSSVYYVQTIKEDDATNSLPEEANDTVYSISDTSNANSNVYGVVVPLSSQDMYTAWIKNAAIEGCVWDNSDGAWENSSGSSCASGANVDSIDTGVTGLANNLSAVVDTTNDDVHLAYISDEATDQVSYKRWDSGTLAWDASATLVADAASDNDAYVTLSYDTSGSDLYTIWIDTSVSDIFYSSCDISTNCDAAGEWAAETNWQSSGTNTWVTSNYSGAGMIYAQWTAGAGSPYSVSWDYVIIPEHLWLFFIAGLLLPGLVGRMRKKKRS